MISFKKGSYLLFLICFLQFNSEAQITSIDSTIGNWNPSLVLKLSPLPIIDRTPAVQLAAEFKAFDRHSLNFEYGYIINTQSTKLSGNKFRIGYRYYVSLKENKGTFIGLQVMDKTVNVDTRGYAWSQDRTFQKLYDFQITNHTRSIYFTSGVDFKMSDKFRFEFTFGLGRRVLNVAATGLPEDVEPALNLDRNIFQNTRIGNTITPAFLFSIKFGYLLFGER